MYTLKLVNHEHPDITVYATLTKIYPQQHPLLGWSDSPADWMIIYMPIGFSVVMVDVGQFMGTLIHIRGGVALCHC